MTTGRTPTGPVGSDAPTRWPRPRAVGWVPWLPLLLAGGFVVWLVSRFSRVVEAIHINPDADFAPVLVRDMGSGTRGGTILVGEASHLTTIWFLQLTRALPFHDVIWDWAPYLVFLAGLGLTAWACRQVAGRWAAAMTFAVGACAEATVLLTVMTEGIRGNTFFSDAALGAILVLFAAFPAMGTWKKVVAATAAVVIAGSALASDPLFLAVGLGPFVGAPVVAWLLGGKAAGRRLSALAMGVAAAAVVLSQLIWAVMRSAGYRRNYLRAGYSVAGPDEIVANVKKFAGHVLTFGHGSWSGRHSDLTGLGRLGMVVVISGAAAYGFVLTFQLWRRRRLVATRTGATVEDPAVETAPLLVYTAFWLLSGLGTLAAFALSSFASGPSDSSRYVIPVFLALAALGPLWGRAPDWRRFVTAGCITVFCALTLIGRGDMFVYEQFSGLNTIHIYGADIVSFLEGEGVTYGYGGYFTSHQLTLMSDLKVYSYPVIACHQPESDTLCPFFVNTRTAWYRPRAGQRTFVIHDASAPAFISPVPPKSLGPPSTTRKFGPVTVWVFDFDVASTFDPACIAPGTFVCPPK
ncbi:MAG: hypothetical protein QOI99_960 [Actinomycetota bacterium]|jgi:hypothetical protein|nr:hypothetical protein [Actinomycetota bacterium]